MNGNRTYPPIARIRKYGVGIINRTRIAIIGENATNPLPIIKESVMFVGI